jgi:hypothetical protein
MKKILKMVPLSGWLIVPCLILLCALVFIVNFRLSAKTTGVALGEATGKTIGRAIGSFKGMTIGRKKGYDAGKEAALTAEDTTAEFANTIKEGGKLQILVASVKLRDVHSVGEDYMALYLLKGEAVFTVDLSQAVILLEDEKIHITVPQPEMKLILDQSKIDKVAEYQEYFFSGSSADGLDAYLNSMKKIYEETQETLVNYDSLMEAARESAEKQITELINAASGVERSVLVGFIE